MHIGIIRDGRKKVEVRSGDKAGHDVAQHEWLVNFFEKNGRNTGHQQNHGQVTDDSG